MNWNLSEAIQFYRLQGAPRDQNALIGLLREIQNEFQGRIPSHILPEIASAYGIGEGFLKAIIGRIPSLRLADSHILEICSGPNCGKHSQIAKYAEEYVQSHPGKFSVKYVPCMRMCRKGPNIKWDGKLYHNADATLLKQLFEKI